ncbi:hypothetical protein N7457_005039 [Penicillium paradoxum]|uniref:uncharacterized protein n=1 Tax=Penicillium paradoxum TaxID=176176 RepID=UPI002546981D|nr:uncharacterized protein N7457_005039 [Penicillium paradoxum]KAJ5783265.1 hypothetical protein N7457_005039 [Penicillium paradoxum]
MRSEQLKVPPEPRTGSLPKYRAAHPLSLIAYRLSPLCGDLSQALSVDSSSMARPKVHPANRLRASTACTACRASKKRCSGYFPCTNCIHKGRGRLCTPFKSLSDASLRNRPVPVFRSAVEAPQTSSGSAVDIQRRLRSQSQDTVPHDRGPGALGAGSHSPEATHRTHPRMLRNLQGERVYVGKAASLSFLQLLRDTVTQHIGPSQFSHNVGSEDMLESETHHDSLNFSEEGCSADEKGRFIQHYDVATRGFLNLGCQNDTPSAWPIPEEPSSNQEKTRAAIIDLMIAIGAQSSTNDSNTLRIERFYFARGQRRAFSNMLEDPSLDLVRTFLLMSFYMLGACRRNTAFMYLGVASRAAVALGLHADSSGSTSQDEGNVHSQRSQLWMSLCVLDLLVSSILGRPSAISPLLPENRREPSWIGIAPTDSGLMASYYLSLILDEILSRLYSGKAASAETAELLLRRLNSWSGCLPQTLRTPISEQKDRNTIQRHTIGNMHVACSYHFAVILVTRPFLISALSVRLAKLQQSLSTVESGEELEEDPAHSRLAAACIDSAVYMLQTCMEVQQSRLLLRNMCLLKFVVANTLSMARILTLTRAFIFAAALVLGFSMFSNREVNSEVDDAFRGALSILRMLALQSAQAAHYLEITTMLEAAINQQRQRLATQARRRRSQYVSRIFSLNSNSATAPIQFEEDEEVSNETPALGPGIPSCLLLHPDDGSAAVTPPMIDGTLFDWEGMDLPLWDSFPFLTEPSTM